MNKLNVADARCAALFVSGLQRSDALDGDAVTQAVQRAVRRFGVRGCEGRMAQEFGDHPEAAMDRMRWVRWLIAGAAWRRSTGSQPGRTRGLTPVDDDAV